MYNTLFISYINGGSLAELPAILKNGGCSVDLFCTRDQWIHHNKYYDNCIIASHNDSEKFLDQLLQYVIENDNRYDWIIPGDETILRMLNKRITNEELFYKIMPLTKMANRNLFDSNKGLQELCDQYDILSPKYLMYHSGMSTQFAASYVGFPMLVKPDHYENDFGVQVCNDMSELHQILNSIHAKNNIVLQQYIKGHEVNTEMLSRKGELIEYTYSRTLQSVGKVGASTQREYYHNPNIEPVLKQISQDFGLNGFGNIAFMFNETDQRHYLIAVNVHPGPWLYYGKFTGNNFSIGVKKITEGDLTTATPEAKYGNKHVKVSLYKQNIYPGTTEKHNNELPVRGVNTQGRNKIKPSFYDNASSSITKFHFRKFTAQLIEKKENQFIQFKSKLKDIVTSIVHHGVPRLN